MKIIFKLILVAGLLYFLAKKGFLSFADTANAFKQWKYIIPAYLCMTATFFLGLLRWHWLLRAQNIILKGSRTVELGMVGNFFNIALPGAVSGDVVKAVYVSKETKGRASYALASILFDRISGVSGLVLVSAMALILSLRSSWNAKLLDSIEVFVTCAGLGVVAFYAYLFFLKDHHDPLLYVLNRMSEKYPRLGSVKRSYEGIRVYGQARGTVFGTLLLSVLIHTLVITACVLFTRAMGEYQVPAGGLFVVVPLGLLVTAVPVTPAGVGTGNIAFAGLFHILDSQAGANVFNLFLVSQLFFGALGGLVYLRFKHAGAESVDLKTDLA